MAAKKKDETKDDTKGEAPKRNVSALQIWLEEAWEGWIKSTSSIFLAAIAFALYKFDLVGEGLAGAGLVLAIILGSLGTVAWPVWAMARENWQKTLLIVTMIVAAVSTGYPAMHAAVPSKTLAETRLTATQLTSKVHVDGNGPYEAAVGGTFKTVGGEAEVSYTIKAAGATGNDEISGEIKRSLVRVHSRKGGSSTSVQERTENVHRLPTVRGNEVTFSVDGVDDQLADGLLIDVRPAGPDPLLFLIFAGLAALGALVLDARLTDQKGKLKSYLAVGVGICLAFAIRFPDEATPHSLVRPAISAFIVGLGGGLAGWLLGVIGRLAFGPKIKKPARK